MLRFAYASDIHLGLFPDNALPRLEWHPEATTVLLAGDIMDGVRSRHIDWVLETCQGRAGLMTLGNHELYNGRRDKAARILNDAFRGSQVTLLLNESVVVDGVRIGGTDLWTNFSLLGDQLSARTLAERQMNDFRKIRVKELNGRYRKLRSSDVLQWHSESKTFITDLLNQSTEPVVLMTHHAPSPQSVPPRYRSDPLSAAFASDLDAHFMATQRPPVVAVHGHIHDSADHVMPCGTRVLANPYGYHALEENQQFHAGTLVSVDRCGSVAVARTSDNSPKSK